MLCLLLLNLAVAAVVKVWVHGRRRGRALLLENGSLLRLLDEIRAVGSNSKLVQAVVVAVHEQLLLLLMLWLLKERPTRKEGSRELQLNLLLLRWLQDLLLLLLLLLWLLLLLLYLLLEISLQQHGEQVLGAHGGGRRNRIRVRDAAARNGNGRLNRKLVLLGLELLRGLELLLMLGLLKLLLLLLHHLGRLLQLLEIGGVHGGGSHRVAAVQLLNDRSQLLETVLYVGIDLVLRLRLLGHGVAIWPQDGGFGGARNGRRRREYH